MTSYSFVEASPLLVFIENNRTNIIGHTLRRLHTEFWPNFKRAVISDMPVIIEMDNCCIVLNYILISDMNIKIGKKDELISDREILQVINTRYEIINYFSDEDMYEVPQEKIENSIINNIEVERFSEAFECCGPTGEMRPDGGDYFSTVRIYLNSGITLCFCGMDAISDGYVAVWCEIS